MKKLKIAICLLWSVFLCSFFLFQDSRKGIGQTDLSSTGPNVVSDSPDIDSFDEAIQKRFLTEPGFGGARIAPVKPQPLESGHVRSFHPVNDDEKSLLAAFEKNGWKVGLYLFGRTAMPNGKDENPLAKFKVRYRINKPVPITWGLKEKHLPKSKKLMDEVKSAFIAFQTQSDENKDRYQFTKGDWTYVAKPVRAVNQSCIRCHTDYVITEKLDDDRFKFRKRAVGDVNGVVVYGFTKK